MNRNRDLLVIFFWAITMLLIVLFTDSAILRGLITVPLVLFLTGHVVLRAIGYVVPSLPEHVAYAVGVSVATCVMGGFLLNWVSFLTPIGWAVWFVTVSGISVLVTPYRGFALPPLPDVQRWHVVILGVAILITGSAYALAVHDEASQQEFRYTEFWMLSKPGKLLVGIKSGESEINPFDLTLRDGCDTYQSM
jgi:hypothetical protein